MTDSDLNELTLTLLKYWRDFLLSVRLPSSADRYLWADNDEAVREAGEEGLSDFIDIIETLSIDSLNESDDHELASALRLMLELNDLLAVAFEEHESQFVRDAFSSAMMRLAAIMRQRGHHCTLPKLTPR